VRALEEGGIRLPAIRTDAPVTRYGPGGTSYLRPFDLDPTDSLWLLLVDLAPQPTEDVAAQGRLTSSVMLRAPCGTGVLELGLMPGLGGISLSRRVVVGQELV
jgi:hypothetical protein